jgi:mannose-6-phosphate isomerase-like protein (cupin superfamily)
MQFQLVDASRNSPCTYADSARQRGRLWPVYETAELLMSRIEIAERPWQVSASDIGYFFFVEHGSVEVALGKQTLILDANRGLEIPEETSFRLANLASDPSYLVMVAGRELLPGSFFNSFSNAYLNK